MTDAEARAQNAVRLHLLLRTGLNFSTVGFVSSALIIGMTIGLVINAALAATGGLIAISIVLWVNRLFNRFLDEDLERKLLSSRAEQSQIEETQKLLSP